ncbi:MAG: putative baseplate assembly protein, partial [Gemmatimonadota bacterium]
MKAICRCCEPSAPATPLEVWNRPSLSAIDYRIGTFGSFRQAMHTRIARHPELAALTNRNSDDYGITTLELWAAVADVLTFYQERYANEVFLRTARFKDSVARVAALIDYRPRPGVAARTLVAFTVEQGKSITVPPGQKIQSVPRNGDKPQTFETVEGLEAHAALNEQRVFGVPVDINPLASGRATSPLHRLNGPQIADRLGTGDTVVLFVDGATDSIEEKKIDGFDVVDDRVILRGTRPLEGSRPGGLFVMMSGSSTHVTNPWGTNTKVFKYRRTFRLFGYNAPAQYMKASHPPGEPTRITWTLESTSGLGLSGGPYLYLDGKYPDLEVGKRLLVADKGINNGYNTLVTIDGVAQWRVSFGGVTDTVTRVAVSPSIPQVFDRTDVVVYELIGDELAFATSEYPSTISGTALHLPGVARDTEDGLAVEIGRTVQRDGFKAGARIFTDEIEKGRTLLVQDEREEATRVSVSAVPTIVPATASDGDFCHLKIPIKYDGSLSLRRESASMYGNVAKATHGETVSSEVLGSGDASMPFQYYSLRKDPLTYLASGSKAGATSTLDLRVGGTRWTEVAGLYGRAAADRAFELRFDDDGGAIVQFGDGVYGAIPPTGDKNIVATYRMGSGLAGRVAAGSLTTLLRKPVGLMEAVNPLAAEGGADPETLATARLNAPRTVRTFGRIVSLQDFADQVTLSGEVAKAIATPVLDGLEQAIHLPIAGQDGADFSPGSRKQLGASLRKVRDRNRRLLIDNYIPVHLLLRAGIGVDPDQDAETVRVAAHKAVLAALDFDVVRLGQSIHLSDIYAVLQDVPGVRYVDIDVFVPKKPAWMDWILYLILLW